jgi:hypothetical protein
MIRTIVNAQLPKRMRKTEEDWVSELKPGGFLRKQHSLGYGKTG